MQKKMVLIKENFSEEIGQIAHDYLRDFVYECLEHAPEDFYFLPNDSEYGITRQEELEEGGLILHTKKAFKIAKKLCDASYLDDHMRDLILVSVLLHDTYHNTLLNSNQDRVEYELHIHRPVLEFYKFKHLVDTEDYLFIERAIGGHLGTFGLVNPYFLPNSPEELVHKADYLANTLKLN